MRRVAFGNDMWDGLIARSRDLQDHVERGGTTHRCDSGADTAAIHDRTRSQASPTPEHYHSMQQGCPNEMEAILRGISSGVQDERFRWLMAVDRASCSQ